MNRVSSAQGPAPLHLRSQANPSLPPLAWCVVLDEDSPTCVLHHGTGVEVSGQRFAEGAWDGDFGSMDLARATTVAGSGGGVDGDTLVIAAPTHRLERLQSLRLRGQLLLSNSLAFLLALADDELDPAHPHYIFDFVRHQQLGLVDEPKSIRTARGRTIRFHEQVNIALRTDPLRLEEFRKPRGHAPASYEEYVDALRGACGQVTANAASSARQRPYLPMVSLSRGYDTCATAALARDFGATEAFTFRASGRLRKPDSGVPVAERLGMTCIERDRETPESPCPPMAEAEFYLSPFRQTDKDFRSVEDLLAGRLVMTGRHGEDFWETDPNPQFENYLDPGTRLNGTGLVEYRLRAGFMHFPVPYTHSIHARAIRRISMSEVMDPWRVGGGYDRPIARRIVEEAGVPRELFGQRKMGGGLMDYGCRLAPECRAAFDEYLGQLPEPRQGGADRALRFLKATVPGLASRELQLALCLRSPLGRRLSWRLAHRLDRFWGDDLVYLVHWGSSLVARRYRDALAEREPALAVAAHG